MSTLDELELEMYRSEKDLSVEEEFGYSDDYIAAQQHYDEAEKMFRKAQIRQQEGKVVDDRKTKEWLKSCKERRATV